MSHWQYRISATQLISINSPLRNCPPRCPKVCLKLSPNDWNPAIIVVNSWLEQIRFEEGKEGETGLFSFHFTTHWLWIWSEVYSMTNEGKLQKISPDILKTSSVCSHFWNRINPLKHCATFQPRVCDIRPQAKKKKKTLGWVLLGNNLLLYCALPFGPLFVSFIIAIRVCPKYPRTGTVYSLSCGSPQKKKRGGEGRGGLITYQQMRRPLPKTKRLVRNPN